MRSLNALESEDLNVELGSNYLLMGTDVFLADQVATDIKRKLLVKQPVDTISVYADEVKVAQLNDLLDTYSIFSETKLLIIKNAEALDKPSLDSLAAYLTAPSDTQSVVVQSEKIDARLSGWKKVKESCTNILCDPPVHAGHIKPWIPKVLTSMGKSMTPQALELFTSRVELDYASIYSELQKLALLVLDKKQISEKDVTQCLGSSRVGTMIDFHRSLGSQNIRKALELMYRMLSSDWVALQVFFQINKFFNLMMQILLLKKNNISQAEIMKDHLKEVFQSQRAEYFRFAESFTLTKVWKIYAILLDTDTKLKLSQGSDALLLTLCLYQIMDVK